MNELISEMAEYASEDDIDGYPVTLEYSSRFAARFAELIIRECIDLCNEASGDRIGKHFGLPE